MWDLALITPGLQLARSCLFYLSCRHTHGLLDAHRGFEGFEFRACVDA